MLLRAIIRHAQLKGPHTSIPSLSFRRTTLPQKLLAPRYISNGLPAKMTAISVSQEEYTIVGDMKIIERFWNVPLDYNKAEQPIETIRLFGRIAVPVGKEKDNLPFMVYLQGGPGFECSFPKAHPLTQVAHDKGYQILYLDQRGTGLSSPISTETVLKKGGETAASRAEWLSLFRADNIVRDCEAVRKNLLRHREKAEDQKWTLVGQSFGGFAATHYLSAYPEGLKEVFTLGGMPPLVDKPDDVYRPLYEKVKERNRIYYKKYPNDIKRVRTILKHLSSKEVSLPNGGHLTPRRFLQLGLAFGGTGGIDSIHQLVLRASIELETAGTFSYKLLETISSQEPFEGNLLYAILHEAIYCQGQASAWSADKVGKEHVEFNWEAMSKEKEDKPVYFTGEMIYPWMFTDYTHLRPLSEVAEILAHKTDWPPLYSFSALRQNRVPVNSAIYVDDMYVDYKLAVETACTIGNSRTYITNAMFHDAIRAKCTVVMGELFRLSKRVEE